MKFDNAIDELFNKYCTGYIVNSKPRETLFRYKAKEILDNYFRARNFLQFKEIFDFNEELKRKNSKEIINNYTTIYNQNFIDAALIYYNIILDLTWALFRLCTDNIISDTKYQFIPMSACSLNELKDFADFCESTTTNPTTPDMKNYLLYMVSLTSQTKYAKYTKIVVDKIFSTNLYVSEKTKIRYLYNSIKHRKQIHYSETTIEPLFKLFSNDVQIASNEYDLYDIYSANDLRNTLIDFDNNVLFPYISTLLESLHYISTTNYWDEFKH